MSDTAEHLIVCPTCGFIEQILLTETERSERPCPECGWTLVLAVYTEDEYGDCEFRVAWHEDDGDAPLYLPDIQQVVGRVNTFLKESTEAQERREDRLTQMRLERRDQSED